MTSMSSSSSSSSTSSRSLLDLIARPPGAYRLYYALPVADGVPIPSTWSLRATTNLFSGPRLVVSNGLCSAAMTEGGTHEFEETEAVFVATLPSGNVVQLELRRGYPRDWSKRPHSNVPFSGYLTVWDHATVFRYPLYAATRESLV